MSSKNRAFWDTHFDLQDVEVFGLALSSHQLATARTNAAALHVSAPLVQADARNLSFSDGAFDGSSAITAR